MLNASSEETFRFDTSIELGKTGSWRINYPIRVIDSARWVNETLNLTAEIIEQEDNGFLLGFGIFHPLTAVISLIGVAIIYRPDEDIILEE